MDAAATAIRTPQNARITDALIQDSEVVVHRFDRDQAGGVEQARSGLHRLDDTIVGSACFDQVRTVDGGEVARHIGDSGRGWRDKFQMVFDVVTPSFYRLTPISSSAPAVLGAEKFLHLGAPLSIPFDPHQHLAAPTVY